MDGRCLIHAPNFTVSQNDVLAIHLISLDGLTGSDNNSESAHSGPTMSFTTPHVEFLKDLGNFLPLGTLTLALDPSSSLGSEFEESYPEVVYSGNSAIDHDSRDLHRSVWALLCLGWLRTLARKHPQDYDRIQIRVYVLPADVGGRYVERSDKDWEHSKKLMRFLDVSREAWDGTKPLKPADDEINPFVHESYLGHHDSLFYIFNTLPSPSPSSSAISCPFSSHAITSLLEGPEEVPGLRTNLYAYQRRSAAMMIKREVQPVRALDPRLEEIECPTGSIQGTSLEDQASPTIRAPHSVRSRAKLGSSCKQHLEVVSPSICRSSPSDSLSTGGKHFYDRNSGVVLRYPRFYEEAKGGILAETMGLGKTLICLAAILATKGHWPQIPPEYSVRQRLIRPRVGSLMDMAAAATNREQIPWQSYLQRMSSTGEELDNCRQILERNVPSYTVPAPEARRSRRPTRVQAGKVIGLSAATLVVVPPNLFDHWKNEIAAHIEKDALKVLYVDNDEMEMPPARELQLCDVILMSKSRFEEEMSVTSTLKNPCTCAENSWLCSAHSSSPYSSPLADLHFLRIIVDEGHDFSSFGRKNNAVFALQKLHVDRRWIVSGTPSSGLLAIEASTATVETLNGTGDRDSLLVEDILESRRSTGIDLQVDPSVRRSALLQERKDLEKLGSIVIDFLNLRPWSNSKGGDAASWKKYIIPSEDGQRKPKSLANVLESLVIRHRVEDIEKDIKLPPLHNRTVYLEPTWHDKLSLNLFIMNLAVNAVTSERVDQDYMFHPKNRASLNQLVTNLRCSGFYWTAFTKEEVMKSIEVSRKYLQNKAASGQTEVTSGKLRVDDFEFLQRAIQVGATVLDSPSWTAFSAAHELGLYIDDFPADARKAWSLTIDTPEAPLIVGAPQMSKAQTYVDSHLYAPDPASGLGALGKTTMDKLWESLQPRPAKAVKSTADAVSPQRSPQTRRDNPISTSIQKPVTLGKRTISRTKSTNSPLKASSQDPIGSKTQGRARLGEISSPHGRPSGLKSALKSSTVAQPMEYIDPSSMLSRTRLSGTASAKMSYLIDRITVLHDSEKILVFYEGDNIAFYIAQTLELLGIQFLIYTGSLSALRKSAYITTFNTTETFRVMLMDVHQAAHGLHIAAASRVFFVNPVWQPTVEAQAIKRAHRIGQKRPVYVETLVLKDTLEDRMLKRRKDMSAQEHHKAEKSLLDDNIMEQLIKDADFIPLLPEEVHHIRKQMAPLQKSQKLFGRLGGGATESNDPDKDLILPEGMQSLSSRKRKPGANGSSTLTGSPAPKQKKVELGV